MSDPYRSPAPREGEAPKRWMGERWEYMNNVSAAGEYINDKSLDVHGREGWELVAISPVGLRQLLYVFKRPIDREVKT